MTKQSKTTIEDIARHANVSKSTVSRVLTGNSPVADDKRTAVMQAMEHLHYQPNIFAQGLAGGQSLSIGVLTQNFGSPVYDHILQGIIEGLNGSDYSPIFADGRWQPERERDALRTLMSRRVDGIIVVGGHSPGAALAQIAGRLPLVVVARRVAELAQQCLYVDNYRAAYDATQYLIGMGHQHIAHLSGPLNHADARARRDGYVQARIDAGLARNEGLIVEGDFQRQSGLMAVETLFAHRQTFSAVFAANDQMAIGARLALFRRGMRVPDDVSLVGFDDYSDSAYMIPPLTTISQPAHEMGAAAAAALLKLIKGELATLPVFETKLIMRESVARLR